MIAAAIMLAGVWEWWELDKPPENVEEKQWTVDGRMT